jgi:hypothetical protein
MIKAQSSMPVPVTLSVCSAEAQFPRALTTEVFAGAG